MKVLECGHKCMSPCHRSVSILVLVLLVVKVVLK